MMRDRHPNLTYFLFLELTSAGSNVRPGDMTVGFLRVL